MSCGEITMTHTGIGKDFEDYPDAVIYIVWSRRGPGKLTVYLYPTTGSAYYMKNQQKDVRTIYEYMGTLMIHPINQ